VVPVVEQHQGFINKFVGDAVVVVFNGPFEQPDHAERAAHCAIAVQKLIAEANAHGLFPEVGKLDIGIGVATGPMLCGNIGTKSRIEYTVIGDTVNLSSRMTGHARPGEVWVSEETAKRLPPSMLAYPAEPIKFKGKDRSVVPYRVWPAAAVVPGEKMRV
jgi:class 3 adenylate cyclase